MAKGTKTDPFIKDPDERVRYGVNWIKRLAGDTLLTSVWAVVSGTVTLESNTSNTTQATVMVVGGALGEKAVIRNRVTTAGIQTYDQTIYIKIASR